MHCLLDIQLLDRDRHFLMRLALLFRPLANGRIKVSFRSVGDVDVARLAEGFGGGGHRKAAGASLEGELGEVQQAVLATARSVLC